MEAEHPFEMTSQDQLRGAAYALEKLQRLLSSVTVSSGHGVQQTGSEWY